MFWIRGWPRVERDYLWTIDDNNVDKGECMFEEGVYLHVFIVYVLLMKDI